MLEVTTLGWGLTIGLIALFFTVDLLAARFRPHQVGFREAVVMSVFYTLLAVAFGGVFWHYAGSDYGTEFFAGYLVERSLSIDNLFVFAIILATFAVPEREQNSALTFGILAALALRVVFIVAGVALINAFTFMFLLFGLLLLWTAIQLYRHRDEDPEIEDNVLVRAARRFFPVTDHYDGGRLVTKENGRRVITPMLLVLLALGGTDLLFALDSIPAVFGVTKEGYIVFVANAFALLGMRPLYFLVKGLLDRLVYLSTGLAVILGFIAIKLILHWAHETWHGVPEVSTVLSLGVIVGVLAVATIASIIKVRRDPTARAHAGRVSLREPRREGEPDRG
jgi:tellurite resistance protein TerC